MPAKLYRVNLTEAEREHLSGITRRGKSSGRKVKRALILCKADEGLTDQQVAEALMVGPSTVGRVRQRFVEGGLGRPGKGRNPEGRRRPGMAPDRAGGLCEDRDGHGSVSGPVASPFAMRYPTLGSLRMYVGLLASSPSLRRSCLAAVRTRRESPDLRRPQTRCRSRS